MTQTEIIKRTQEICKEFDARVIEVSLPIARLELSKALAEAESMQNELTAARAALSEIRTHYGQVCHEFETCEHPACAASYSAWAVADQALGPVKDGE